MKNNESGSAAVNSFIFQGFFLDPKGSTVFGNV